MRFRAPSSLLLLNKGVSVLSVRSFSRSAPAHASRFQQYLASLKPNVREVTLDDFASELSEKKDNATFHVFDVRETNEWNQGHIPHTFYTGRGNLERDIESLVPDTHDQIILLCAGGVRSVIAADTLQKMGYKDVRSLKGGFGAWCNAGYPVSETGATFSDLDTSKDDD